MRYILSCMLPNFMLKITHPHTVKLDNIVHTHPNAKNTSYAERMSPRAFMCICSDLAILLIFKLLVINNTRQLLQ